MSRCCFIIKEDRRFLSFFFQFCHALFLHRTLIAWKALGCHNSATSLWPWDVCNLLGAWWSTLALSCSSLFVPGFTWSATQSSYLPTTTVVTFKRLAGVAMQLLKTQHRCDTRSIHLLNRRDYFVFVIYYGSSREYRLTRQGTWSTNLWRSGSNQPTYDGSDYNNTKKHQQQQQRQYQ